MVTFAALELPVEASESARARFFKTFLVKLPLARDADPSAGLLEASASDSDALTVELASAQSEATSSESVVSADNRSSLKAFVDGWGVDGLLHIPCTVKAVNLDAGPLVDVAAAALALGVVLARRRGKGVAAVLGRLRIDGVVDGAAGCGNLPVEGTSAMTAVGTTCLGRAVVDTPVVCYRLTCEL